MSRIITLLSSKVLKRSEMLEYYEEVSGCYIIRPLAYNIWQEIQSKSY